MSVNIICITPPKFRLGQVVITANAHEQLEAADIRQGLSRHSQADWGEVCPEDAASNNEALKTGGRLLSVYLSGNKRFWIITECDRSVTTILMPQDY